MKLTKLVYMQIFKSVFILMQSLLFLAACDTSLTKEIDFNPDFTPRLSVNAYLDGGNGYFVIRIMESFSLAERTSLQEIEIIRNGEIRLFKDGEIIRTIPGPIDMSRKIDNYGFGWKWGQNGYHTILTGIDIFPGSIYRLEVDIEGFPMAVAASVMPEAPVFTASIDTSVQVVRKKVKEVSSAGYYLYNFGGFEYGEYPERYWPLSVLVNIHDNTFYKALDVFKMQFFYVKNTPFASNSRTWGLGASDALMFLADGMDYRLLETENFDLYLFSLLTAKDIFFSDALRIFYTAVDESIHKTGYNIHYEDDPDIEKITVHNLLFFRVRNITPATYKYNNSMSLQYEGGSVLMEPEIVVGNIEGGYGGFSVHNTTTLQILEWETYEYRKKEK